MRETSPQSTPRIATNRARSKNTRMRRFFFALWILTPLAHIVFGVATDHILRLLGAPYATPFAVLLSLLLSALLPFRARLLADDKPISALRRWCERLYFAHFCGTFVSTALYLVATALLFLVHLLAPHNIPFSVSMLLFPSVAVGLAAGIYGVFFRAAKPRLTRIRVPIKNLAPELDGYTIAQLSDLHVGALLSMRRARRWIRMTNAEGPHVIALTGDYVTSGTRFHQQIADILGPLRARDGVFAVLGNHDYFDADDLVSRLRNAAIVVLRNERKTLQVAAVSLSSAPATLEIAGIDDAWTRNADVEKTFRNFAPSHPLITLCHDPALFPDIVRSTSLAGPPASNTLVLSGHTHWGQVGLPFVAKHFNFARRVFRFSAGLYREGEATLYVSAGLGTTGPPIRFGSAPEIAIFTLCAASE